MSENWFSDKMRAPVFRYAEHAYGIPRNITPSVKVTKSAEGGWSRYWQDSAPGKTVRRGCEDAQNRAEAEIVAARRYAE